MENIIIIDGKIIDESELISCGDPYSEGEYVHTFTIKPLTEEDMDKILDK